MIMLNKEKFYKIALISIFAFGFLARFFLYIRNQSLWLDEAMLAANILNKSYSDLFRGLDYIQVCPVLFSVTVKFLTEFVHSQNMWWRDLVLRILPFISGILSLPAFYILVRTVFHNNKKQILIAMFLFCANPCAIIYSAQLKQYSTELLCAIILLTLFYKIIVKNKCKSLYVAIIAIAPWISYSSLLLEAAGFTLLLFKNRKAFMYTIIPTLLSLSIYYFVSLKFVFAVNYVGMDVFWSNAHSFIDFYHPLRLFIRTGELFVMTKHMAIVAGGIVLLACFINLISKADVYKKMLYFLPILFTVVASYIHKYPYSARLILFLLPIFIIMVTTVNKRVYTVFQIVLGAITLFSLSNFTPDAQEVCYSYAREVVDYLEQNVKPSDIIIIDASFTDYDVYLKNGEFSNRIFRLHETCLEQNIDKCRLLLENLPYKNFYFLSASYNVKEIVGANYSEINLGFRPKKCKFVYVKG